MGDKCACGCGGLIVKKNKYYKTTFIKGHNNRGVPSPIKGIIKGKRSEEIVNKIAKSNTGKKRTEEQKKNISVGRSGQPGRIKSQEEKNKISKSSQGKKMSPEAIVKRIKSSKNLNYSKEELSLLPYLEKLGFISTSITKPYFIHCKDRIRVPDYFNPVTKEVVEYWGTYWHKNRKGIEHESDVYVVSKYHEVGWHCVIVWTEELEEYKERLTR